MSRKSSRSVDALAAGLAGLTAWLRARRVEVAAMEATGVYWEAPWDALTEAGVEVKLLHAQQVKLLWGRKTDIEDSRWLARVCQFGLGTPSVVPARELRELRALSRYRRTLVGQRSRVRNRVGKVLDLGGARVGGVITDIFGVNGRRIFDGLVQRVDRQTVLDSLSGHVRRKLDRLGDALRMPLRDADRILLEDLLVEHDDLDRRLAVLDRRLHKGMVEHADRRRLLEAIPGVDRVSAVAILVEASPDPVAVFGSAKDLAAWAGVCPGNHKRQGARTRPGAKRLRAVLIGCAHGAARTRDCQFHAYHRALIVRRGYKRAVVATAHKLARTVFAVLRDAHPLELPRFDGRLRAVATGALRCGSARSRRGRSPRTGDCRAGWCGWTRARRSARRPRGRRRFGDTR